MHRFTFPAVCLLLVVTSIGCRSTTSYSTLADAGVAYAVAADSFLDEYAELTLEANSESLINESILRRGPVPEDMLKERNAAMVERLQQIRRAKERVSLLRTYFEAVGGLANTDAPSRAAVAANSIAVSVGETASLDVPPNAFGIFAELIFGHVQSQALRDEIAARSTVVETQLSLFEAVFEDITKFHAADFELLTDTQYDREVRRPIITQDDDERLDPVSGAESWKVARREYILRQAANEGANQMANATAALRNAWAAAASDELTDDDLRHLIQTLTELATAIGEFKASRGDR